MKLISIWSVYIEIHADNPSNFVYMELTLTEGCWLNDDTH
jgi:hypothetical protein